MSCPFAHDDAAYVLGALSPGERLEFERHLPTCDDCTRAVQELAGLPGLLGRVDASVLEHPQADEPVPHTLLPALSREVVRRRRRRTLAAAGVAAAVVAVAGCRCSGGREPARPGRRAVPSAPSAEPSDIVTRPMAPVGEVPVEATIGLEQVKWGTRLLLTCSYEPTSVEYDLPPAVDYTLFVRTRGGTTEQVGSWRSIGGTTMHLAAATSSNRGDIESVEVRTPGGRVVLRTACVSEGGCPGGGAGRPSRSPPPRPRPPSTPPSPVHDSSTPKRPTVAEMHERRQRREPEAQRQERRDPVPPDDEQQGDHRTADSVEHERRPDDVGLPHPVEPQVRGGPPPKPVPLLPRADECSSRAPIEGRSHLLTETEPPTTAFTFRGTTVGAFPRRSRTCGPGRSPASPARAGAPPAGRRGAVAELRLDRGPLGQEGVDEGVGDLPVRAAALPDPAQLPVRRRRRRPTSSVSGIGQTVSAAGIASAPPR